MSPLTGAHTTFPVTDIYYRRLMFFSHFNAGVRAVDIRDPDHPKEVARGSCNILHRPSVRDQGAGSHAAMRGPLEEARGSLLPVWGRETGERDTATRASHLPRAVLSAGVLNLMLDRGRVRAGQSESLVAAAVLGRTHKRTSARIDARRAGDDGDAHPADRGDDGVRRPRRERARRAPAGPDADRHPRRGRPARRGRGVGRRAHGGGGRAPGLRRVPTGGGVRQARGGVGRGDLPAVGRRRAGGPAPRADPRAAAVGREGGGDGPLPRRARSTCSWPPP